MAHQIHNIYTFDNEYETLVDLSERPNNDPSPILSVGNVQSDPPHTSRWRPSPKFQRLYDRFQNTILSQWPRIACVYCGRLLYPEKACWIFYDASIIYPLQERVPGVSLPFNPNVNQISELRVSTCESCKKPSTRFSFPHLSPLPEEIVSVPLHKRRYLSPVYLYCSLGRTPNSNPYSEHRRLTGTMSYSHNIRAHALYSGALGAFLEPNNKNNNADHHSIHDENLQQATSWLTQNNSYFKPYANITLSLQIQNSNGLFPTARYAETNID